MIHPIVQHAHPLLSTLSVASLLLTAGAAAAEPTAEKCLALEREAWREPRKCQAVQDLESLSGRSADLEKCDTRLDERLERISAKASSARARTARRR